MVLIRKSISIWILCELIVLPFTYSYLPSFGSYFHWFLSPATKWVYQICSGDSEIINPTISDSVSSYIVAAFLVPLIVGAVLLIERGLKKVISIEIVELLVLYFLSFFLLRYGLDKVLGNQFQPPEPNILNAAVGDLSKDLLFWTSMGTSSIYNQFLGWSEVITGVLILMPRSRKLALYLSFGIFTNVFFINIGFDISVKFLSALLLITSGWLLILERSAYLKTQFKAAYIAHSIGLFLLLELALSSIKIINKPQQLITGTYIVKSSETAGFPVMSKLHLNSKSYLIIQKGDKFSSYPIKIKGKQIEISLNEHSSQAAKIHSDTLSIYLPKDTVIAINSKKNYLLLQDNIHWMVEHF